MRLSELHAVLLLSLLLLALLSDAAMEPSRPGGMSVRAFLLLPASSRSRSSSTSASTPCAAPPAFRSCLPPWACEAGRWTRAGQAGGQSGTPTTSRT
eukprot:590521-Hanusia_phi.AAC.1